MIAGSAGLAHVIIRSPNPVLENPGDIFHFLICFAGIARSRGRLLRTKGAKSESLQNVEKGQRGLFRPVNGKHADDLGPIATSKTTSRLVDRCYN